MRIHTYVIATDAGSAPNYDPPFVTLAVCKPRIRQKASIGDVVIAFAGKDVNRNEPNAVVWAGVVSEKLTFAAYWNDQRFHGKRPSGSHHPDNFYRPVDGNLLWVENPVHGPEAWQRDTSGIYALVFNPAWRFGANGPLMPEAFGLRMTTGRRGERVVDLTATDWIGLRAWLDEQAIGTATITSTTKKCRPAIQPAPVLSSGRGKRC